MRGGCVAMYRIAMEKLMNWKESKRRKPLIIEGARQVGKTWLMKEFGKSAYRDTVYINFDSNSRMSELFASDLDIDRLIMGLELYAGRKIDSDNTLLIAQVFLRKCSAISYCMRWFPSWYSFARGHFLSSGEGGLFKTLSAVL